MEGGAHNELEGSGRAGAVAPRPINQAELLRVIDRTIHESPRKRRREIEFHLYNPTDVDLEVALLPLEEFAEDLRVLDDDGSRLAILPNRTLVEVIEALPEAERERIEKSFEHVNYRVAVLFPKRRPLQSESTRVVTFRMEAPDVVEMAAPGSVLGCHGWRDGRWLPKFFSIPTFEEETTRYPGEDHDHFLIVRGLEDYEIASQANRAGAQPTREIYPPDDGGRVTSTRLPEADNGEYTWRRSYQLRPIRTTTAGILVWFWLAAAVLVLPSGLVLGWAYDQASTFALLPPAVQTVSSLGQATSAGIVGTIVGLLVALKAGWTERYKTLLLITLVLHVLLWIGWFSI